MQNRITKLAQCVFFLVISSCSVNETVEPNVMALEFSHDKISPTMSEYVDSVSYLVLKENDVNALGNINRLVIDNNLIYAGDYRLKKISVFSIDGEPKFVLDKQGRGPGEYLEIKGFSVLGKNLYVLDNYNHKVHIYDSFSGKFVKSLKLPAIFDDIEALENGGFLLAYSPQKSEIGRSKKLRYRVVVADNKMQIINGYLNYQEQEQDAISFQLNFTVYGDKILFASFHKDSYYIFDRKDGRHLRTVSIKSKTSIPEDLRSDVKAVHGNYSHLFAVPYECKEYAYFTYYYDEHAFGYLAVLNERKIVSNSEKSAKNNIIGVIGGCDDYFIGYIQSCSNYDMLVKYGFPKADSLDEAAIHRDEPFLIRYHMK